MRLMPKNLQNTEFSINQLKKLEEAQPYNQADEYLVNMLNNPLMMKKKVYEEYTRKCIKEASLIHYYNMFLHGKIFS